MKRTVSDLMVKRDFSNIPTIDESKSVHQAVRELNEREVGALLVTSSGLVTGVFSERDFARDSVAKGFKLSPNTRVSELMTRKVIYVTPDYRLDECLAVMAKMKVRHLPVLRGQTPIAFLSMRHIMDALIEENKFMVEQLVTYITGSSASERPTARSGLIMQKGPVQDGMML